MASTTKEELFVSTVLAPAYLFSGRFDDARKIYQEHKDDPTVINENRSFREVGKEDRVAIPRSHSPLQSD